MMFRWIPRSGNGRHSSRLDGMMENVRLGAHRLHSSRPLPTGVQTKLERDATQATCDNSIQLGRFWGIKSTGEASPVRGRDWAGFKFAAK